MIEPVKIEPDALYDASALRQAFGISPSALAAARRAGALRYTRAGNRTLYRGAWLLAWMESTADAPQARSGEGGGR